MALSNVFAGALFSVLAGNAFVFNAVVALTIANVGRYRRNVCYRIIFSLTLCGVLNAFCFLSCGMRTLLASQFPEGFEQVLGAIVQAYPYASVPLDAVLAANRVFVMGNKCCIFERYRIYDVLMAASWMMGMVAFGLFVSPECRMAFIGYTWDSRHCASGRLVPLLEFVVLDPIRLGTFVAYLVILGIIVAQNRSSSISTISATFERCILMFSVLSFAGGITISAVYNVYKGIFPEESLVAAGATTVMILMSSVNPMFLLVANNDMRRRALTVLGLKKDAGNGLDQQRFKPRISIVPMESLLVQ